ncbi:UDP-N-acetylmuramoylalanyl-D-glutamate--2,6-diaminopimelate ligase [Marinitoga hydrogenitolerans DSM 16785]|uniref:UDP-N-acetylmuramyl-tripeptide synthetase n=1 Tax=Marinitoga hydrogenitolerans (strain DSM 16785 / JCM 12826 / AT1271) TaxID=1122195 RepID=A0A1M4TF98_MARH1|nr:UDP-N-acetylmuramoyl-L-alanyl-D-glutamate--2,6-diaminopimelate ligase [Marinitoga hydrogenitolerans]SHE43004.1 UDP-N-acetylmuramoylalanyl-D-glutamate--2,6-diaminopimelate ligase [Marinitoga hydrogenitolerans DSM 16785]
MTGHEIIEILKDLIIEYDFPLEKNYTFFTNNTNKIKPESVFVCIKGAYFDGHDFVKTAIEFKASLIIGENPKKIPLSHPYILVSDTKKAYALLNYAYYNINFDDFNFIGVTGTNGKTTVISLIHYILTQGEKNSSLISTVGIKLNDELLYEPYNTTPGVDEIAKILSLSKERSIKNICLEVSSHALDQKRVYKIPFSIAILTNITRDHLDYHKSFEEYKQIKFSLFKQLKKTGYGIINLDCINIKEVPLEKDKIITYGFNENSDYVISNVEYNNAQMSFIITEPDGTENKIHTLLIGEYNAQNITAAFIALKVLNIDNEIIRHGLLTFNGVPGRFQLVENTKDIEYKVYIDFAHTPDALEKVLKSARKITKGRIILVFGAGGAADIGKRKIMGEIASKYSDLIVITDDDPKDDDPEEIIEHILEGIDKEKTFIVIRNRKTAIKAAVSFASRDDIVIIAGRGHEKFQLYENGKKIPFNDYEIAYDIVQKFRKVLKR